MTPIGAHLFLNVPMVSLANRVVELDQVIGPFATQLAERLFDAADWPARFDVLDAAIASRLASARQPSPVTGRALTILAEGRPWLPALT